jgi:hypothetical protein
MPTTTITILERECPADDFDTESGQGMPDDVEPYELEVITLLVGADRAIQAVLDEYGVGQWDGSNTAYDPDGTHLSPNGTVSERWARIDR